MSESEVWRYFKLASPGVVDLMELTKQIALTLREQPEQSARDSADELLRTSKATARAFVELQQVADRFEQVRSADHAKVHKYCSRIRQSCHNFEKHIRVLDSILGVALGSNFRFRDEDADRAQFTAKVLQSLRAMDQASSACDPSDGHVDEANDDDISAVFDSLIQQAKQASSSELKRTGSNTSAGRSHARARSRSPSRGSSKDVQVKHSADVRGDDRVTQPKSSERKADQVPKSESNQPMDGKADQPSIAQARPLLKAVSMQKRKASFGTLRRVTELARFASQCNQAGCRCTNFGSNIWQKNRCVNCMHFLDAHVVHEQTELDMERTATLRNQRSYRETSDSPKGAAIFSPIQADSSIARVPIEGKRLDFDQDDSSADNKPPQVHAPKVAREPKRDAQVSRIVTQEPVVKASPVDEKVVKDTPVDKEPVIKDPPVGQNPAVPTAPVLQEPKARKLTPSRFPAAQAGALFQPSATMFLGDLDLELLRSSAVHVGARMGDVKHLRSIMDSLEKSDQGDAWSNQNANLQTPLHVALQFGHVACATLLIERYADAATIGVSPAPLAAKDKAGRTALHYAARYGLESVLRDLFSRSSNAGFSLLDTDMFGDTALHLAAANKQQTCVRLLLKESEKLSGSSGAAASLVDLRNNFQETPLHKAARSGDPAIVELMTSYGADVLAIAAHGTPADVIPPFLEPATLAKLHMLLSVDSSSKDLTVSRIQDISRLQDTDNRLAQSMKDLVDDLDDEDTSFLRIEKALGTVYGSPMPKSSISSEPAEPGLVIARPLAGDICVFRSNRNSPELNVSGATVLTSSAVTQELVSDLTNFVEGVFEPYRNNYFNKRHLTFCSSDLFGSRDGSSDAERPPEPALFIVKRSPSNTVFEALFVNKWGFNPILLPARAIASQLPDRTADSLSSGAKHGSSDADLTDRIASASSEEMTAAVLTYIEALNNDGASLDFSPTFDRSTRETAQKFMEQLSPARVKAPGSKRKGDKNDKLDVEVSTPSKRSKKYGLFNITPFSKQRKSAKSKRSAAKVSKKTSARTSWYVLNDPTAPGAILGVEAKLGRGTVNSFGLVSCKAGQDSEEDYFKNPSSPEFNDFCSLLGDKVDVKGWSGFAGGFDTTNDDVQSLYTSWRGFEVMWHSAPLLTPDMQRRLLGNDKVIVYHVYRPKGSFVPTFRGNVNSVGIVVAEDATGYSVEVFSRSRIQGFHPELPAVPFKKSERHDLKNWIVTTALNAMTAVYQSPPYVYMLASAWNQALQNFVDAFPPK